MTDEKAKGRRPTEADLDDLMYEVAEGSSLRAACIKMKIDPPATYRWIYDDPQRSQHYARTKEVREDLMAEEMNTIAKAAALGVEYQGKKIDPAGARVLLDNVKWQSARMAPKAKQIDLNITSDPDARKGRIAALLKKAAGEDSEEQADG